MSFAQKENEPKGQIVKGNTEHGPTEAQFGIQGRRLCSQFQREKCTPALGKY